MRPYCLLPVLLILGCPASGVVKLREADTAAPASCEAPSVWYADVDRDGYGDADQAWAACDQPAGYTDNNDDCDDTDANVYPGATEDCDDPNDYNCDGSTGRADDDGDGYAACEECDDSNGDTHPGATELCDDLDNDCDGDVDEGADTTVWYSDADGDGYGNPRVSTRACGAPDGYVASADDCDDADATAHPNAAEVCDGVDNDCSGEADEATAIDALVWYTDADGDGFGVEDSTTIACDQPDGYADNADDCYDANSGAYPGAESFHKVAREGTSVGNFDYNCDGVEEAEATDVAVCRAGADVADDLPGWSGGVPGCGGEGAWTTAFPDQTCPVTYGTSTARTQACR